MQRLALFIGALVVTLALAFSFLAASLMANYLERSTERQVRTTLIEQGFSWTTVRVDGLIVNLAGPAPSEGARFNALKAIKALVNGGRIRDSITIVVPDDLYAPKFSLEMLRNGDGISLIGLIPEATGRQFVLDSIDGIDDETTVTDMLETTDYPEPEGWKAAVDFALDSLKSLPRSKISVVPQEVTITAITDSQDEKLEIEGMLSDNRPEPVALNMHISAPRPVITPFSLRLIKDASGTRFDSCSADSDAARSRILASARRAGFDGLAECTVGLGVPTPRWGEAVETAIGAITALGGGSLTFSDADITLVAPENTAQVDFDRIIHAFEQSLPDVFSVHAVLPPKPAVEGAVAALETPELSATKSPEGLVQLRGRLRTERSKTAIHNFALAQFGSDNLHDTTRIDESLPDGWPLRVLAGIEALAKLHNGILLVQPNMLELRGISDRPEARTEVTQILSEKLGDASQFKIDITYQDSLNRQVILPTPQECVDRINAIFAENKIEFAPSSTRIEGGAFQVVERIAIAMADCIEVAMEIGGHTDSQGREAMNLTLSQARAEAVLDALLSLEVLTTHLSAKGYGESQPVADNGTEEGRAANRRIEFKLVGVTDPADQGDATEADTLAQDADEEGTDPDIEHDPDHDADSDAEMVEVDGPSDNTEEDLGDDMTSEEEAENTDGQD